MKVPDISPVKFTVPANQNVQYLYNHVNDAIIENHTGAVFTRDRIEITAYTKAQKEGIISKLKEIQAKFIAK